MTGHVTLPCEVYIWYIHFDNDLLGMVSECSGWMQGCHASGYRFNSR